MRTQWFKVGRDFTGVKRGRARRYNLGQMKLALVFAVAIVALAADLVLVQPPDLAKQLSSKSLTILQVGPNVLYRSKHIPGAIYAGPAKDPAGIALLKATVEKLPRDREIVIYCGCCPWDVCPNIKPAMETLRAMGFTKAKALYLQTNFKTNWIDQNLPVGQ